MQSLPPGIGKCPGGRSFLLHNKIIGYCKEPLAVLGNGHIQAIATRLRDARQGEGLFPGLQGVHGQIIAVAAVAGAGIGNILQMATLAGFVSEDATSPPQS